MGYDVKDENSYKGDISIEYSGLRPGEKLFEELLIGGAVTGTEHPKIMRAEEDSNNWEDLEIYVQKLKIACRRLDLRLIRQVLMEAVDGFEPGELQNDPLWDIDQDLIADPEKLSEGKKKATGTVTTLFK